MRIEIKKLALIASLAICGLILLALTPASVHATDWPMFHGDAYNDGVSADAGPLSANGPYWNYNVGSGMSMGSGIDVVPIVGDGKVYVISYNGSVYAFFLNGTPAWNNTALGGQDSFIVGNPAYNDHALYVELWLGNASAGTGAHAIDTDDGSLIWSDTDFPKCEPITPIIYDDGMLYFGTWQASTMYYGVNATTGAIVWARNSTTGGGYYWSGAAAIGNYLVYGDDAGHLTSVDKATGALMDDLNVSQTFGVDANEIRSSIAYDAENSRIFFTSQGGYVYSLGFNTTTGTFEPSESWDDNIGFSTSTPAVYDGRLYVGGGTFSIGGKMYCLNETDGSTIWTYEANGGVQSSPVVSVIDGKPYVYFTTNCANGTAYCIDANGGLVWSFTPPENKEQYMLCGVTVSDGWAFFGNDAGYLFAFGSGTDNGKSASGTASGTPGVSFLPALLSVAIGAAAYATIRKREGRD